MLDFITFISVDSQKTIQSSTFRAILALHYIMWSVINYYDVVDT